MRASWTAWIVAGLLAASVIHSIYLGFRVAELERALARARPAAPAPREPVAAGQAAPVAEDPKVIARLESLEDDLADLQENYASLDEQLAGGNNTGGATDETKILDVVTKAQARVRDRQLEFHSAQWHKNRDAVAEDFGAKNNLERWQIDHIKRLLDEETDQAVEILERPDVAEHPEQLAAEWQRHLDATDAEALRVLEGPAAQAWVGARLFERQVLWPWLPSLQPAAKQPR